MEALIALRVTYCEPDQKARFADAGISDQHELKKEVAIAQRL